MLNKTVEFIKGYIIIEIKGNFTEKFINLAIKRGIKIRNIQKKEKNTLVMKISIKDFFKLKGIGKISECKINIASKKGAVFGIRKYRKRTALFGGVLIFIIVVKTLSCFVLNISITGTKRLNNSVISRQLRECGIHIWAFNNGIDSFETAEKMMAKNDEIAWIGIEVKGSKVNVEIVEKKEKPSMYDDATPYNIVALRDGIIDTYFLKKGFPVAKKGDTVKKGQLLVSGVTDSNFLDARYMNPDAEIKIITWINSSSKAPLIQSKDHFTGKHVINRKIVFNNMQIGTFFKVPYKFYNIKTTKRTLFFGAEYVKIENIENVPEKIVYKDKDLFEIEKKKLYNNIIKEVGKNCEMLDSDASYTSDGENIFVKYTCRVKGTFCEKVPIQR